MNKIEHERMDNGNMELKQINEKTFYIPGLINIGLYLEGNQVILIDSGNDESAGRKIYQLLEKQGWKLRLVPSLLMIMFIILKGEKKKSFIRC